MSPHHPTAGGDLEFSGRIALVTGGAGSVGRVIVERLAERGATVLLNCFHSYDSAKEQARGLVVRRRAAPGQKIGRGRRRANAPSAARREVRTNARGELDAYSSVAGLAGQGDIGLAPLTRSPVIDFHVLGLPEEISRTVRDTMLAPEYGHPAIREIARGTGPCRTCLNVFRVGEEERLLFTCRPAGEEGTLGAPGPVFIHARPCRQFRGSEFPQGLRTLALFIEGRASGNRILMARRATGPEIDDVLRDLLADAQVDYLHVRHGEAGCYITRVSRGPIPRAIPGPISTVSRKVRPSVRNRLAQLQPALVRRQWLLGKVLGLPGRPARDYARQSP